MGAESARRAISPVIATVILIVVILMIALAAGAWLLSIWSSATAQESLIIYSTEQ